MKTAKKLVSILLAVMMIVVTAVSAVSIGATDLDGHTYTAYQIFKGTQAENATELGNVVWGNGVNWSNFLTAIKGDSTFDSIFSGVSADGAEADAAIVAKALSDNKSTEKYAKEFAKKAYANKATGIALTVKKTADGVDYYGAAEGTLDAGYYLVVDSTVLSSDDTNTIRNLALVRVTENNLITISQKVDLPTVQKKVKDTNDSTGEVSPWQDAADYDIGDTVPFQLTATLPNSYTDYDKYQLIFNDKMSSGLTFGAITKVYLLNGSTTTDFATSDYAKADTDDGFTVTFSNLKSSTLAESITNKSQIVVEYNATLNENAQIGSAGNPNYVSLTYSNNPNNAGEGEDTTGTTPEDKVVVFTYKLTVNKTDDAGDALSGAAFKLEKWIPDDKEADGGKYVESKTATLSNNDATFTFSGIDAGKYKLSETTTPAGYNTANDIIFTITATYSTNAIDPKLTGLSTDQEAVAAVVNSGSVTGELKTSVINAKGGTLPSTGGMGTTLFTVCGVILMGGAAILLVTRKRMSK
jgi:fimbrial isopeptide formation D2 family protein/LPXTG-motif cell wall-anchored protein